MSASSLANFKVAFYKRPWFLITIAIVVVVAVSVITDLPNHISRSQDLTAQNLKDSTKKGVMGIFGGKK